MGRLTKQKNFSYLINEFSKFHHKKKNCHLVILGEGEEIKKLSDAYINLVNNWQGD